MSKRKLRPSSQDGGDGGEVKLRRNPTEALRGHRPGFGGAPIVRRPVEKRYGRMAPHAKR